MWLGVPCAIAETVNLARLFREHDLGLVLPRDPAAAAGAIRVALADPSSLRAMAARGQAYAAREFSPERVAAHYLAVYERAVGVSAPVVSAPSPVAIGGGAAC
jgi:glycosyltransferase involved in cell wall biosynthesis